LTPQHLLRRNLINHRFSDLFGRAGRACGVDAGWMSYHIHALRKRAQHGGEDEPVSRRTGPSSRRINLCRFALRFFSPLFPIARSFRLSAQVDTPAGKSALASKMLTGLLLFVWRFRSGFGLSESRQQLKRYGDHQCRF